jgi:protein involved in polysaccharide export with SLBB domain
MAGNSRVTGIPARYRIGVIISLAITVVAALVLSVPIRAQQTDLSQQMDLFNSLPPDQQQSILQRLSGGGGTSGMGGLGSGSLFGGLGGLGGLGGYNSSQSALIQQQLLQQQRRQLNQDQDQQDQFLPPVFKPGDTVLVDISLRGELPKPEKFANGQSGSQNPATNNSPNSTSTNTNVTDLSQLSPAQRQRVQQQMAANNQRLQEQPEEPIEALQADERQRLVDLIDLVRAHNPYRLDSNGELLLPGIPAMAVAGLTEDLATRRAEAEPAFSKLDIRLTRLPLQKSGEAALKPFGYDLFDNSLLSATSALNSPVPADYVMGPGDVLQVQLFGTQNQIFKLTVARDGRVSFPQLGPIEVAGQRYSEVKNDIEARVARQMIGVRASVSMGETRTISVFVLGEASYPGSYTVTGLATVTSALFAAGGVKRNGSLRAIQLKRQGQVVRTVDLYDLLMRGDSANDAKLLPGDVVFVPSVGPTVSIDGEVQRPAVYELKGAASVLDLINMGGGLTPQADRDAAALIRVDDRQRRIVVNINPSALSAASPSLRNGDALRVLRLRPQLDLGVTLQGYVYRPKYFAWRESLRLSDVVSSVDELKPNADQHYLLIRREILPDRRITVLSADLAAALRAPGSAADLTLMPRDVVSVFDLETSRSHVIQPLMDELRVQANLAQPTQIVHIDGRVKVPGDYPLESGMRVSDLIRAGGSLDSAAYGSHAELSRYIVDNGEQRRTEVLSIDLAAIRSGERAADVTLQPFDRLSIKQISGWTEQDQISLKGEVRFPGTYAIQRGETLRSVVQRAGGLTDLAFPAGSVFTRRELMEREQEQLDRFAERMRMAIAEEALEGARGNNTGSTQALSIGQALLDQIKSTKAVGRLVINLQAALHARPGSSNDIILRNGDELIVPKQRQEIMVLGEVQSASSHLYQRHMSRDDYIDQSGGVTRQADRSQIYVVRADGSVDAGRRGWFSSSAGVEMRPGDAVVVPLDTERLPGLVLWQSITTILYNIAIATATARTL